MQLTKPIAMGRLAAVLPGAFLASVACLVLPAAAAPCATAADCSLGGECVRGSCVCDKTWAGPNCAALNLLPANRSEGMHQPTYASWGGLPVEEAGQYHLFFADFTLHCGLGSWGTNSQVSRAVSDHPAGPYTKVEVLAVPFHHNPTLAKAPDGTLLLVSIGNGTAGSGAVPAPAVQRNCTAARASEAGAASDSGPGGRARVGADRAARGDSLGDPPLGGVITTRYSKSVKGPWTQLPGVAVEPGPPSPPPPTVLSAVDATRRRTCTTHRGSIGANGHTTVDGAASC